MGFRTSAARERDPHSERDQHRSGDRVEPPPFGGANHASTTIRPWTIGYLVVIVGLASLTSSRRDL